MKDSQILSAFQESMVSPLDSPIQREKALVFDACHVGVVMRAVLGVEIAAAIEVLFYSTGWLDWLTRLGVVTAAAFPAVLLWLVVACMLKRPLQRLDRAGQIAAGAALGALAGLYGCAMVAIIGIVAAPPWLASALAGALFATCLVMALVWRAAARLPARAAARLSELQSRIRPHFLFNTLNSAIALVRAEPAKAEAVLEDLSELFRSALEDRGDAVNLSHEIHLAKAYLAIEEVRFGQRLRVIWSLDADAATAKLPPLLLQPLVENAVKHGVEPSASGADVRVSTQKRGSMVVIKVSNTVPAGQGARGHGVALRNVRDRLRLLHDVQSDFRASYKDGLYQVRMEIPA